MRFEIFAFSFVAGLETFCKNHPGILLVILGVAGEVICEWNKEKGIRGKLIKVFGFLLVAGLILELWEAVKADEQVAQLTQTNLVLRSNVVALEIKLQPRRITVEQVTNFMFLTDKITKIPIAVRPSKHGDDTVTFAYHIRQLLDSAGFGRPTNSNDLGLMGDAFHDPIFARRIADAYEWPSVMLVCGSNGIAQFPDFHYEITNGFTKPIVSDDSPAQIYNAILFCFRQIEIVSSVDTNVSWIKPSEFEFVILPKNN